MMVQVDVLLGDTESTTRFSYVKALLATLVDTWRPEMHTFHLLCREMVPMLEDVSLLLGLP